MRVILAFLSSFNNKEIGLHALRGLHNLKKGCQLQGALPPDPYQGPLPPGSPPVGAAPGPPRYLYPLTIYSSTMPVHMYM